MAVNNKWAILFAGIAGILSVWGYWGGGTAAGLLPEKDKNIEVSSASGEASDGFSEGRMDGGSRKVYDAALHRREGPMKDPFHVAGIEGECKIVCVNRYCMNLLYAPYWGKQR